VLCDERRRSVCLRRAAVRGEYTESSGGVPGLVDWSTMIGETVCVLGEAEGAGLFIPADSFDGDLDCQFSPK